MDQAACVSACFAARGTCAEPGKRNLGRYGIQVLEHPDITAAHRAAESSLVRPLPECCPVRTGAKNPKPIAIGGGTCVHGIPGGVAFGCGFPGLDSRMYFPNEPVSVEHPVLAAKIFALVIAKLCRQPNVRREQ